MTPEYMNVSIKNIKQNMAVNKLQIGQHQRLKQEQHVFLNPIHNQVTNITRIGRNNAKPYNHGEMH